MASLAQIDEYYHAPTDSGFDFGRFLVTDKQFKRPGAEAKQLDTGLRSGIKLQYSGELSQHIENAIARIAELERRQPGWDSHGGRALNDRAVHPAFRLIVDGFKMCCNPRIQLNSMGDLDLIWESETRYLEIAARADGNYEIFFENGESGEEFETATPVGYGVAQEYLTRFCSITK